MLVVWNVTEDDERPDGYPLKHKYLYEGFMKVSWPGRMHALPAGLAMRFLTLMQHDFPEQRYELRPFNPRGKHGC